LTNNAENGNSLSISEFRQSLILFPRSGNQVTTGENRIMGYYADGFFDRRQIHNGVGNIPVANSTVSLGNSQIAVRGALFYNPYSHASLFFPATGYRSSLLSGRMENMGGGGYYFSGSRTNTSGDVWILRVHHPNFFSTSPGHAHSIRCVLTTP
jgi:hypothetical protein